MNDRKKGGRERNSALLRVDKEGAKSCADPEIHGGGGGGGGPGGGGGVLAVGPRCTGRGAQGGASGPRVQPRGKSPRERGGRGRGRGGAAIRGQPPRKEECSRLCSTLHSKGNSRGDPRGSEEEVSEVYQNPGRSLKKLT